MFQSYTYGKLELKDIPQKLMEWYEKNKEYESDFSIVFGTDSQNFSDTKMVSVITMICEGHGGIFFYDVTRMPLIEDVRQKLYTETNASLNIANEITAILATDYPVLYNNCHFSIHIDAGKSKYGKTKDLIPELVGWISNCTYDKKGELTYDCEVKPESFVASSIADKISK